jgi:hypothetical protein
MQMQLLNNSISQGDYTTATLLRADLQNNLTVCWSAFCHPVDDYLSSGDVFAAFDP